MPLRVTTCIRHLRSEYVCGHWQNEEELRNPAEEERETILIEGNQKVLMVRKLGKESASPALGQIQAR